MEDFLERREKENSSNPFMPNIYMHFLDEEDNIIIEMEFKDIQFGEYGPLQMGRTDRYKLILRNPDGPDELFDLVNDPRETTNIIDDPAVKPVVEELRRHIRKFYDRFYSQGKQGLLGPALRRCNETEAWRT